ncbi:MAG TPA: hypothetical protein VGP19_09105 [Candidatus Acidoferrales bacterium]|jgi:hypothetical protein|nr:hypothetical protein [Candidatus Acidoferrales bacterium]
MMPRYQSWICLKFAFVWTLGIALSALPIRAQKGGSGGSSGSGGAHGTPGEGTVNRPVFIPTQPGVEPETEPGVLTPTPQPIAKPTVVEDESCLPWDLSSVRGSTVSAARLQVPGKARGQYEKACGALKKKKLTEAEQHARDAIQTYQNYSAAWVMLGQVLEGEQKMSEAHDACSQPIKGDPTYLPPYLCLAGLLDHEKDWDDLLTWSDQFRGINLPGDMYSNYYRGLSLFHLHKFSEAQKTVLAAIVLDSAHHQPGLNFLLAQIYGQQGDVANATVQIQQFMKYSNSRQDKDAAKQYLSDLQSQQNSK